MSLSSDALIERFRKIHGRDPRSEICVSALGARKVSAEGHLLVMGRAQPYLSGAISKTVNLPEDASIEDIRDIFIKAWRLNLKALAVYRDGSKGSQPLNVQKTPINLEAPRPSDGRERLPNTRDSVTHKFTIGGHEGYFTVGVYPDGRPGELFLNLAKEGSTVSGFADGFATMLSIALQRGAPLEEVLDKMRGTSFQPSGFTSPPISDEGPNSVSSVLDYVARWMYARFCPESRDASPDGETCGSCGGLTVWAGKCRVCVACGTSGGCG